MIMRKYLFFFLAQILLFISCGTGHNKNKNGEPTVREFNEFGYIYHFYKEELEKSHMDPSAYKPKVFDIRGKVTARLYPGDTLFRFVYKGTSQEGKIDSSVELLKPVKLGDKERSVIPSELLGCNLIGAYLSTNEDAPENAYQCFYVNENDDLLRVVHLFKPGNVSTAFFYTKKNIDPTDKYKSEIAKLLAVERRLSVTDTVNLTH